MDEARQNSLEYLVETNLLEFGYSTCMSALSEIGKVRVQLDGLIRRCAALPFSEQRVLTLAGLLHDLKKPAVNHGELGAEALDDVLAQMALHLPQRDAERLRWLIQRHLDVRPLINQMGTEGDAALQRFAAEAADPSLVISLILFTYADRVAVRFDLNANANAAAVLDEMATRVEGFAQGAPPPAG